jgi:uncharacterized membrane protein YeaQ/YmgE (transglycosylase-associated protein family)
MNILIMLLIGLVVGAVARVLMPGRPGGVFMTVAVGLGGSLIAGYLSRAVGWFWWPVDGTGIVASVVGAMLLLTLFGMVVGQRDGRTDKPHSTT